MKIFISISLLTLIVILLSSGNVFSQEERKKEPPLLISIEDARLIAIQNNLDVKLAHLDSMIKGTDLSYKEAIFDTILNGEIDYTNDQTKVASSIFGSKNLTDNYNIGIQKKLRSGTDVGMDWTNKREWTNSAFVSTNPYHESRIEITLSQPISKNFFGLIDRGNIALAKWAIKNADLDSYIKIEDAIVSTEKAYWTVVLMREEFRLKKEMLKKAIRLFNQYRAKLKMGTVETGDVLAAEANIYIRESSLLSASNELETAEELLKVKLNLTTERNLFPTDSLTTIYPDTDFIESLRNAFQNRRDYISKKNDIKAKNIKLKMKSNSRFPEIDLKASFATNGISSKYYSALSDILEESNPKYYVGIEFKYPLENNEANSLYEKATLEKTKAIINLQKTERQIISDIDKGFRNLSINRQNISKMERVENLQKGKLIQEEKRFRYGRSSSDILIRYQEDLLNAQLATQKAYFDYRVSIVDLMDAEDSFLKGIGIK